MVKILLRCISWLRFTGIVTASDDGDTKHRRWIVSTSADFRLFGHILMAVMVLLPEVVKAMDVSGFIT